MMKEQLEAIRKGAMESIAGTKAAAELDALRVKYLGKKGELTAVLKQMGSLSAQERPVMGQMANEVRAAVEKAIESQSAILQKAALEARLEAETVDVTIPGKAVELGHKHPMYTVLDEIKQVFLDMGFEIMDGPEIELEYGKDSASVTFTATRNGVAMDNPVVNVTLPEGGLLEYANGTFTAKKGGNGVVKFVLGDNLASKDVEYTVIANLLSSTRKRGNVAIDGNNVTIANGNSGIAATYPAKVWKIGGTVSYNEFGDQSGAEVIGFTSGKGDGDTFGGTLILGITSGDVKGIRYIEWFQGWGNNMKWINVDGYQCLLLVAA